MKTLYVKSGYFFIILILVSICNCSGFNYHLKSTSKQYKIYLPTFGFFIEKEILTMKDENDSSFYVLTNVYPDTFFNKTSFEKIQPGNKYYIHLDKIDTAVVIKTYDNLKNYTQNGVVIWSEDTVRVPIYSSKNLFGRYIQLKK